MGGWDETSLLWFPKLMEIDQSGEQWTIGGRKKDRHEVRGEKIRGT